MTTPDWKEELRKQFAPNEITPIWNESDEVTYPELESHIISLLEKKREEVEKRVKDRINVITQGTGKTNKEMGDVYADTQHAEVCELRFCLSIINSVFKEN